MDKILVEALKKLSNRINLSTGLLHPSDECFAKELFKFLKEEGVALNSNEIASWAVANKWSDKHATDLGSLAERIGQGNRVVIKFKDQLNEQIKSDLRKLK